VLMNFDAFPGEDAGRVRATQDNEDVKKLCSRGGCGGFVTWNTGAFLRKRPTAELSANRCAAAGSFLHLPLVGLMTGASADCTLPSALPEVTVDGAGCVDKLSRMSFEAMSARFARSQPVVLTDAQRGWPARAKWNFEFFAGEFGDEEIVASDLAPFFAKHDRSFITTVKVSMKEYIRYVLGIPNGLRMLQKSTEQVFYANAWTPFLAHKHLADDVSNRLYCVQDSVPNDDEEFNHSLTKVFMGPAGTISRLHHDTYATHVWLSQIRGRKQFICYSPEDHDKLCDDHDKEVDGRISLFNPAAPDYDRYPRAREARPFSVVVEEGETVVLPSRWWHWAKSLTPSLTLMRNFVNETNIDEYCRIVQQKKQRQAEKGCGRSDTSSHK